METIPIREVREGEENTGTPDGRRRRINGETLEMRERERRRTAPGKEAEFTAPRFMVEANKAGGGNTARTQKFSCSYVRG